MSGFGDEVADVGRRRLTKEIAERVVMPAAAVYTVFLSSLELMLGRQIT